MSCRRRKSWHSKVFDRGGAGLTLHGTNPSCASLESGVVDAPNEAPEVMEMARSSLRTCRLGRSP
jgi:hypothetical protein